MSLGYTLRLLLLAFGVFFLVNAACGLAVRLAASRLLRRAARMRAQDAARLLFAARVLPAAAAWAVVVGLCVPSYLWLEPAGALTERASGLALTLAALGAILWLESLARASRALWRSAASSLPLAHAGDQVKLAGMADPVRVVESPLPVLALVGVLRPRVVISSGVLRSLSPGELQAALAHERAHRDSRENVKRLLMLLAPDALPFTRILRGLEHHWARFAEWSADDRATGGDDERSAALAMALVRVARLGVSPQLSPVSTTFLSPNHVLIERVHRLTAPQADFYAPARPRTVVRLALALGLLAGAGAALHPGTFRVIYDSLELLLRA